MKNTLTIKLNPFSGINSITQNNKALPAYSQLNNFINKPFLEWVGSFLDTASDEINDEYNLIVSGHEFELCFIEDLQNDYDSCSRYTPFHFEVNLGIDQRIALLRTIFDHLEGASFPAAIPIKAYSNIGYAFPNGTQVESFAEDAFIVVTDKEHYTRDLVNGAKPRVIFIKADENKIIRSGYSSYLWYLKDARLNEVINITIERFVDIPVIRKAVKLIDQRADSLSLEDQFSLISAKCVVPQIVVNHIEDIIVGERVSPIYHILPAGTQVPDFEFRSSDPSVIEVQGKSLYAAGVGSSIITVDTLNGDSHPFKQEVSTLNLIRSVNLICPSEMEVGKTIPFKIEITPKNATDINSLKLISGNEGIITIDWHNMEGYFTAHASGETDVHITSSNFSTQGHLSVYGDKKELTMCVGECLLIPSSPELASTCRLVKKGESYLKCESLADGMEITAKAEGQASIMYVSQGNKTMLEYVIRIIENPAKNRGVQLSKNGKIVLCVELALIGLALISLFKEYWYIFIGVGALAVGAYFYLKNRKII